MPTAQRSFLRRVSTRPYRPTRNEREDRLTEIVAAIVDDPMCGSLGAFLAQGWLELVADGRAEVDRRCGVDLLRRFEATEGRPRVLTQVPVARGTRRVDLALVFQLPDNAELTLSVEAKIEAEPERGQLLAYREWIESRHGAGLVVLAAPRSRYPAFARRDEVPADVALIPWERTASLLKRYLATCEAPAESWLVGELLAYMREEDLVDPDRLENSHIESIALYDDAWRALSSILDTADTYVQKHWAPWLDGHEDSIERWSEYPSKLPDESAAISAEVPSFTWDILFDGGRWFPDRRQGFPVFTAGIHRPTWLQSASATSLAERGFELFSRESGTWKGDAQGRVYRRADLDAPELDLASFSTIEEQGTALGAWIEQAFRDLGLALAATDVLAEFRVNQTPE